MTTKSDTSYSSLSLQQFEDALKRSGIKVSEEEINEIDKRVRAKLEKLSKALASQDREET